MAKKIDWQQQELRSRSLRIWRRYREAVKAKKTAAKSGETSSDRPAQ